MRAEKPTGPLVTTTALTAALKAQPQLPDALARKVALAALRSNGEGVGIATLLHELPADDVERSALFAALATAAADDVFHVPVAQLPELARVLDAKARAVRMPAVKAEYTELAARVALFATGDAPLTLRNLDDMNLTPALQRKLLGEAGALPRVASPVSAAPVGVAPVPGAPLDGVPMVEQGRVFGTRAAPGHVQACRAMIARVQELSLSGFEASPCLKIPDKTRPWEVSFEITATRVGTGITSPFWGPCIETTGRDGQIQAFSAAEAAMELLRAQGFVGIMVSPQILDETLLATRQGPGVYSYLIHFAEKPPWAT